MKTWNNAWSFLLLLSAENQSFNKLGSALLLTKFYPWVQKYLLDKICIIKNTCLCPSFSAPSLSRIQGNRLCRFHQHRPWNYHILLKFGRTWCCLRDARNLLKLSQPLQHLCVQCIPDSFDNFLFPRFFQNLADFALIKN